MYKKFLLTTFLGLSALTNPKMLRATESKLNTTVDKKNKKQFEYESSSDLSINEQESIIFKSDTFEIPNIDKLEYITHLSGGSGGVYKLQDKQTGKFYTLKYSSDQDHLKEEITTDALYEAFDIKVPAFAVLKADQIVNITGVTPTPKDGHIARLAEFVDGKPLNNFKDNIDIKEKLAQHYVVDALLSNWDVVAHGENILVTPEGELIRIDNGGGLRSRAIGGYKTYNEQWDPYHIPELKTLQSTNTNYYSDLKLNNLNTQYNDVLQHGDKVLAQLQKLHQALHLKDFGKLQHMVVSRLNKISLIKQGTRPARADQEISSLMAAGALVYSEKDGKKYVLLAKRRGHDYWANFGGKSDDISNVQGHTDKSLVETAEREVREESMGLFDIQSAIKQGAPSHDLVDSDRTYRMYLTQHNYVSPDVFHETLAKQTDHHSQEHTDFIWIEMDKLVGFDNKIIDVGGQKIELFEPFYNMLQQPGVQHYLKNIKHNKSKNNKGKHTQGWAQLLPEQKTMSTFKWQLVNPSEHDQRSKAQTLNKNDINNTTDSMNLAKFSRDNGNAVPFGFNAQGDTFNIQNDTKVFLNPYLDEQIFARAVVNKALMNAQIKNFDVKNLTHKQTMLDFNKKDINDSQANDRNALAQSPYTQSEAGLKIILGNEYEEIPSNQGPDSIDVRKVIQNNIINALKKHPTMSNTASTDTLYINTLTDMIIEERKHSDQVFVYHGTDAHVSFYTHIMTMMRKLIMASDHHEMLFLRGNDQPFSEHTNIDEFIKFYTKGSGQIDNYEGNYQDKGLSVNASLFGSYGQGGSESFNFFYNSSSAKPPEIRKLFNLLTNAMGINANFDEYEAVFKKFTSSVGDGLGSMYQIIIDPKVINNLVYLAIPGGSELKIDNSSKPKESLKLMRQSPDTFLNKSGKDFKKLQARLYPDPHHVIDQSKVKIKTYRNRNIDAQVLKNYDEELRQLISKDIAYHLHSKNKPEQDVIHAFTNRTPIIYKHAYEGITGQEFKFETKSPPEKLAYYIFSNNIQGIEAIIHQDKSFVENFLVEDYRDKRKGSTNIIKHFIDNKNLAAVSLLLDYDIGINDVANNVNNNSFNDISNFLLSNSKENILEKLIDLKSAWDDDHLDYLIEKIINCNKADLLNKLLIKKDPNKIMDSLIKNLNTAVYNNYTEIKNIIFKNLNNDNKVFMYLNKWDFGAIKYLLSKDLIFDNNTKFDKSEFILKLIDHNEFDLVSKVINNKSQDNPIPDTVYQNVLKKLINYKNFSAMNKLSNLGLKVDSTNLKPNDIEEIFNYFLKENRWNDCYEVINTNLNIVKDSYIGQNIINTLIKNNNFGELESLLSNGFKINDINLYIKTLEYYIKNNEWNKVESLLNNYLQIHKDYKSTISNIFMENINESNITNTLNLLTKNFNILNDKQILKKILDTILMNKKSDELEFFIGKGFKISNDSFYIALKYLINNKSWKTVEILLNQNLQNNNITQISKIFDENVNEHNVKHLIELSKNQPNLYDEMQKHNIKLNISKSEFITDLIQNDREFKTINSEKYKFLLQEISNNLDDKKDNLINIFKYVIDNSVISNVSNNNLYHERRICSYLNKNNERNLIEEFILKNSLLYEASFLKELVGDFSNNIESLKWFTQFVIDKTDKENDKAMLSTNDWMTPRALSILLSNKKYDLVEKILLSNKSTDENKFYDDVFQELSAKRSFEDITWLLNHNIYPVIDNHYSSQILAKLESNNKENDIIKIVEHYKDNPDKIHLGSFFNTLTKSNDWKKLESYITKFKLSDEKIKDSLGVTNYEAYNLYLYNNKLDIIIENKENLTPILKEFKWNNYDQLNNLLSKISYNNHANIIKGLIINNVKTYNALLPQNKQNIEYLFFTQLNKINDIDLTDFENLKELTVTNCSIKQLKNLQVCKNLTKLSITKGSLTELYINDLEKLSVIDINEADSLRTISISNIPNLKEQTINGHNIQQFTIDNVTYNNYTLYSDDLPHLKDLKLSNVTGFNSIYLDNSSHLETVKLNGQFKQLNEIIFNDHIDEPIKVFGLKDFKKNNPNVIINGNYQASDIDDGLQL